MCSFFVFLAKLIMGTVRGLKKAKNPTGKSSARFRLGVLGVWHLKRGEYYRAESPSTKFWSIWPCTRGITYVRSFRRLSASASRTASNLKPNRRFQFQK